MYGPRWRAEEGNSRFTLAGAPKPEPKERKTKEKGKEQGKEKGEGKGKQAPMTGMSRLDLGGCICG